MPRRAEKRFDGNAWYEQYIVARTTAALKEKEKSFSDLHAGDSEQELIQYVRRCADEMGYTPTIKEIIGGTYIAQRFGGWPAVLKKAELVADHACPAQTKRYIFMKEREVQAELHRQEREAKRKTRAIKNKMRVQKNTETQGSPGQVERK